jgi:DNA-binding CsgD family transcriptional regulator
VDRGVEDWGGKPCPPLDGGEDPSVTDASRREQILTAYASHARRFDQIASCGYHPTGLFPRIENSSGAPVPGSAPEEYLDSLSEREQQVLSLVALGLSNAAISEKLSISAETVKTHVRHIVQKLHAHNRANAVFRACERGLLSGIPAAPGRRASTTEPAISRTS